MKILVTGSDGFIGGNLFRYFEDHGYDVYGTVYRREPGQNEFPFNCIEWNDYRNLSLKDPDIIIHTIGLIDQKLPARLLYRVNARGAGSMAGWGREHGCKHFIQISSISVYGLKMMGENRFEHTTPRYSGRFTIPYGRSKALAEEYIEKSGIPHTILRLPGVLGVGDTFASRAVTRFIRGGWIPSGNKGDKMFSTLCIKNLGPIIEKIIRQKPLCDVFNCTDYHLSWPDFVKEYAREIGLNPGIKKASFLSALVHYKDKEYQFMLMNSLYGAHFPNEKLLKTFGVKPVHSLRETVGEIIKKFNPEAEKEIAGSRIQGVKL